MGDYLGYALGAICFGAGILMLVMAWTDSRPPEPLRRGRLIAYSGSIWRAKR